MRALVPYLKEFAIGSAGYLAAAVVAAASIGLLLDQNPLPYLRVFLGIYAIFLLPGYSLMLVFFPKHELSLVETLSISMLTSVILNILLKALIELALGQRLSGLSHVALLMLISLAGIAVAYRRGCRP